MHVIEPLFAGPVDIIGDVHGEIDALEDLLGHLGYGPDGQHVDGRRLVFVGDLTDRGPDSPAVLRKVMRWVRSGRAQCVIGNHELNLLRGERKDGNDWWVAPAEAGHDAEPVTPADKVRMTEFLHTLPLALERRDLRVVHACWNESAFTELRDVALEYVSVLDAYEYFTARLAERWSDPERKARLGREWHELTPVWKDRERRPRLLPTIAQMDREYQMNNPVRVLTSGEEAETETPFWAGGKWRMVERLRWWERYDDPVPVVIGHYWRRFGELQAVYSDKYGPDLFAGVEMHHCMGPGRNVYCVDFSVGGRHAQRAANEPLHMCRLAAVRVPEWQVVYDQGETQNIDRGANFADVDH
jgi:Calcineurin-like phosphoesterase